MQAIKICKCQAYNTHIIGIYQIGSWSIVIELCAKDHDNQHTLVMLDFADDIALLESPMTNAQAQLSRTAAAAIS